MLSLLLLYACQAHDDDDAIEDGYMISFVKSDGTIDRGLEQTEEVLRKIKEIRVCVFLGVTRRERKTADLVDLVVDSYVYKHTK